MRFMRFLLAFICTLLLVNNVTAQSLESDVMMDVLNLIRTEKFDFLLPHAMRDNDVDMWIHVVGTNNSEEGHLDPLRLDLGGNTGYFIFTDRGGDRIERAAFGRITSDVRASGAYDIIEGNISDEDLAQFVAKRDPQNIGVNYSEWLTMADGISHTDYTRLVNAVGDKYAKRFVSAEYVINDFRSIRVMSEIVFYGELCRQTVKAVEKAFDMIEPGVTTPNDIGRWLRHKNMSGGYGSTIQFGLPGASARNLFSGERVPGDGAIQAGDLVSIDFGIIMMNYRIDLKRAAYVMGDDETVIPPQLQEAFDEAMKARKILRANVKVGRTAKETKEIIGNAMNAAGFSFVGSDGVTDPKKTTVSIDLHPLGHQWSDDAVGPRLANWGLDREHLKIPSYFLFVLEYVTRKPVPEWGEGKNISLSIEDDVVVTERGVEFLYPPIKQIRLIR